MADRSEALGLSGEAQVLVFGCEHGVPLNRLSSPGVTVIALPCSGMLPPSFLEYALKKGTEGVFLTGCREGDCFHRYGNTWVDERLAGKREPHLFSRTDRARIEVFRAAPAELPQLMDKLEAFRASLRGRKTP